MRSEIDALRRRVLEESQRDVDMLGEVARVLGEIDEVRTRGYARLSQVFAAPHSLKAETPPPLQGHGPFGQQIGGLAAGSEFNKRYVGNGIEKHYREELPPNGSYIGPDLSDVDPEAYARAVEAAYDSDHYGQNYEAVDAQAIASRFVTPRSNP